MYKPNSPRLSNNTWNILEEDLALSDDDSGTPTNDIKCNRNDKNDLDAPLDQKPIKLQKPGNLSANGVGKLASKLNTRKQERGQTFLEKDILIQVLSSTPGLITDAKPVVPSGKNGTIEMLPLTSYIHQPAIGKGNKDQLEKKEKNNSNDYLYDSACIHPAIKNVAIQKMQAMERVLGGDSSESRTTHCESSKNTTVSIEKLSDYSDDFEIARFTPLVVNPTQPLLQRNDHANYTKRVTRLFSKETLSHQDQTLLSANCKSAHVNLARKPKAQKKGYRKSRPCYITRLEPEIMGCVINSLGVVMWICPSCKGQDDGTSMIRCDKCESWYHFTCVGINDAQKKELNWFCSTCLSYDKVRQLK